MDYIDELEDRVLDTIASELNTEVEDYVRGAIVLNIYKCIRDNIESDIIDVANALERLENKVRILVRGVLNE